MRSAVFDGHELLIGYGDGTEQAIAGPHLSILPTFELMASAGVDILWLTGAQLQIANDPGYWSSGEAQRLIGEGSSRSAIRAITNEQRGGVIMRGDDPRWQFAGLSPSELAACLARLNDELRRHIALSPGTVGLRLLEKSLSKHRDWIAPLTLTLPNPLTPDVQAVFEVPRRLPFVHLFDTNSAYLSAARNTDLGSGEPVHYDGDEADRVFHLQRLPYGLWRLRNVRVFAPLAAVLSWHDGWYTTGMYKLMLLNQEHFELEEAWIWPDGQKHRILRAWGDELWESRQALDGYPEASSALKRIITSTIGMFNLQKGSTDWWYRPDWRAEIVAQNAAKQARTMHALRARHIEVLACYVDAIAVASEHPDPLTAVGYGAEFRIGKEIGSYKHVASYGGAEAEELIGLAASDARPASWFSAARRLADGHD